MAVVSFFLRKLKRYIIVTIAVKQPKRKVCDMQETKKMKLTGADIGYRGRPVNTLTREELLEAFLELSQKVYECASQENTCKDLFSINKSSEV